MSGKISLVKQAEKVKISLQKRQLREPPVVRVGQALDISGSMHSSYMRGDVAQIVFRTLALAKTFDDNGEMDMWVFNDNVEELPVATEDNFETYVKDEIINGVGVGGGTRYSPCLKAMSDFYFPNGIAKFASEKKSWVKSLFGKKEEQVVAASSPSNDIPALAIFLTDGENGYGDDGAAEKVFKDSQSKNIYWLLMGVGSSGFGFLQSMADKYPNVGFLSFSNLEMSDEELYDGIISQEFVDWVQK